MSAARLNSRALTVRGTLPQIGSFSLESFIRRSDLCHDGDLTCSMAAWRRRFSAWRSFASLVHACHPGAGKRTADSRRSHGVTRFASMIEPPHFGCGRQAALCRTVYFVQRGAYLDRDCFAPLAMTGVTFGFTP
jgi:hypothetical protein